MMNGRGRRSMIYEIHAGNMSELITHSVSEQKGKSTARVDSTNSTIEIEGEIRKKEKQTNN